ncbi:MAG TPA: hemin ABC transporter substrate-binding protein [Kiloniellaceae bacterium]|nr:hemin ABC transporter substrate-binding protein [Kiloniellaceae bacterium]
MPSTGDQEAAGFRRNGVHMSIDTLRGGLLRAGFALLVLVIAVVPTQRGLGEAAGADGNRVVSVGGSITEIVYALGAGDRLIAVDSTSLHPPEAQGHPDVGYMRRLSAEPILAMKPTLLLAVEDAGPATVLDQLRAAGTKLVIVPDDPSSEGVLKKVSVIAEALGLEDEGQRVSDRLRQDLVRLGEALEDVEHTPSVLFLLSIGRGAPLAAGRETSAASIIELAGGRNAIDAFEGYKPLSPEAMVGAEPDFLLVTDRTLDLLGGEQELLSRPEIAATPAGREARLITMNGLLLLGFGPRTPEAIRNLAAGLHPELSIPSSAN